MNFKKLFRFVFILAIIQFPVVSLSKGQVTYEAKLIYKIFASIEVISKNNDYERLFDEISKTISSNAEFDQTDPYTLNQLNFLRAGDPSATIKHFPFRYLDSSGAKITVFLPLIARFHSGPISLGVIIGYGREEVPDQQLLEKIDQLNNMIESACSLLSAKCTIRELPLPKSPGEK